MPKFYRIVVTGTAVFLAECNTTSPDSPEQCVERFAEQVASVPPDIRAETFFTYEVADFSAGSVPKEVIRSAEKMTFAGGDSDTAVEAFYANKDKVGPAIFGADGISLYRSAPVTGLPATTIDDGCVPPFEGARLVRVDWHFVSSSTDDAQ